MLQHPEQKQRVHTTCTGGNIRSIGHPADKQSHAQAQTVIGTRLFTSVSASYAQVQAVTCACSFTSVRSHARA